MVRVKSSCGGGARSVQPYAEKDAEETAAKAKETAAKAAASAPAKKADDKEDKKEVHHISPSSPAEVGAGTVVWPGFSSYCLWLAGRLLAFSLLLCMLLSLFLFADEGQGMLVWLRRHKCE